MIMRESFLFDPLSGVSSVRKYFRQACVVCPSRGILFVVERVHLQVIISEGVCFRCCVERSVVRFSFTAWRR